MGRRALLRLAGQMPPSMEKLRTTTEHQPAVCEFGFPRHSIETGVNIKRFRTGSKALTYPISQNELAYVPIVWVLKEVL